MRHMNPLCCLSLLILWTLHISGKVLPSRGCNTDPFTYLNINQTTLSSRHPPSQKGASNTVLDELATIAHRWMPECDDQTSHAGPDDPRKVFKDASAKSAPTSKPMTKLDQGVLEDLIWRSRGVASAAIAESRRKRRKRSLSGNFTISTYLRAAESPYEVMSDLLVPEGVTVNVDKGVELRFRPGFGLTVRGRLVARGTRDDPILFVSLVENTRWKGLTFEAPFKPYDVRLTGGQGRSDGYLETYDGHAWRLVCFQGWTRVSGDVACKQMGFVQGASPELPTVTAAPLSKSYWLSNVDCSGSEKSLKDCRSSQTTACQRPTVLRCLGDFSNENTTQKIDSSILEFVNCSDSETGIVVKTTAVSAVPTMNFVTAQNSLNHGLSIETFYTPDAIQGPRLYKCLWVNNRVAGLFLQLRHPPKDGAMTFVIEECLATVGGGDGIKIEGRGNVHIVRSAAFGNARNGIDIRLDSGSVKMDELVIGANSGIGVSVARGTTSTNVANDRLSVSLTNSKLSGHWAGPAANFDTAAVPNCEYAIERNEFWENYNGCILFPAAVKKSAIEILANNFTRNRGPMVRITEYQRGAKARLEGNVFHLNILSNHSDRSQAVVRVGLGTGNDDSPSVVQIIGNRFTKNTMQDCVSIEPIQPNVRTQDSLLMQGNWLADNLVTGTVLADIFEGNITLNTFMNPVSQCELRTGLARDGPRIDARNNYWGASDEISVRKKICDGTKNRTLALADILPWTQRPNEQPQTVTESQPILSPPDVTAPPNFGDADAHHGNTLVTSGSAAVIDNQPSVAENYEIAGTGKPYSVAQNLLVSPKSTLTIAPGAVLEFDNDRGLRVQGTIIAKGTEDEPIIFRAALGRTWSGIMFDNKNSPTSVLEHCIIDGARIGLTLNSDKLAIHRCIVSNSVLSGITLTDESGEKVDLGDTTVLNAQDIGLRIANRYRSIDVKNFNVDNTGGNGIDFDQPVVNVSFSNCRLSNSRRYALHVDQMMSSKQTLALKNCTLVNQNGVGGVFLVARDYGLISIANTLFSNNNARSLIVDLKCNFTGDMKAGQPSRFELIESRFENNNDNVVDIHLAFCSNADISRNTFLSNNRDHRYGVFHLQLDPLKRPTSTGGKENFNVGFRNNLFRQNAGEFSAYMLPMSMADFTGIVNGNRFIENENRRSVLVMGSPVFLVNNNEFDNRKSTYNLEAEYNDAKLMDATNNYWGTVRESEIHDTIFDGTKIPYRGTVKFVPFLVKGSSSGTGGGTNKCDRRGNCRGNGDCIGDQVCACFPGYFGDECEQFSCRDLNDCSRNGRCAGPNKCQCFNGWAGADCRSPMCFSVGNCSTHGECVSLNECQCETGWSGADCSVQTGNGNGGNTNHTSGAVVAQGNTTSNGHGASAGANNTSNNGQGTIVTTGAPVGGTSNAGQRTATPVTIPNTVRPSANATGSARPGNATGAGGNASVAAGTGDVDTQCPNQCSGHGRCLRGNACECETGWRGPACASPDCSGIRNCSGHGVCVAPSRCACENGYAGANCGICVKNSTNEICQNEDLDEESSATTRSIRTIRSIATVPPTTAIPTTTLPPVPCTQICEHGFCDTRVGQCQCYVPWTGPNCDQCTRPSCSDSPIRFVSPESAPALMAAPLAADYIVRVVGGNFTKPRNNRYVCRYGRSGAVGVWLSNTDIECSVPPNQPAASVNFSITPLADDVDTEALINDDSRPWILAPMFFTFYGPCKTSACDENGFCFRGSCYCSPGGPGATEAETCDQAQSAKPSIDTNSLDAFTKGARKELEATSVQLKTKNGNDLIRWELVDGPVGATINAATGQLTWPQPRGSSDFSKFTVSARSPYGSDSISWSVTVPITYQPVIDQFLNGTNANGKITVHGHVNRITEATQDLSVPVKLVVYKNGQEYQEWEVWTDSSGVFESNYTSPSGDGGKYTIVVMHPGNLTAKTEGPKASGSFEWAVQAIRVLPRDQAAQYDNRERASVLITVENLGTAEVHITEISSKATPATVLNVSRVTITGTNTQLSPSYALQPRTNTSLNIELTLFTSIPADRSFPFDITTREGASAHFSVKLKRSAPGPWLAAEPSSLRFALVYDHPWPTDTIRITNDGRATARNLIIQLSADSFVDVVNVFKNGISIINNRTFDLAPGESVVLATIISPPSGLSVSNGDLTGRSFSGNVTIDFISRDPTVYPLIIPFAIEFRSNSMIDRYNVSVFSESSAPSARQANAVVAPNLGLLPVPGAVVGLSNPFLERNKTTTTDVYGVSQFTNVPAGYYLLSVDKAGFVPFRRVVKISLVQSGGYRAVLEDYFNGGQQHGGDAQLEAVSAEGGKGGFQLQPVITSVPGAQNGSSPYLELDPRDLALPLDNISVSENALTLRNLGGVGADGLSMSVNDSRLPIIIESETVDVPSGQSRTLRLSVKPNAGFQAPPADQGCDAYLVSFYYNYQTGQTNGTKKIAVLIKNKNGYETENVRLCEIDPSISSSRGRAVGLSVRISCECRASIMRQCLSAYSEPLAVCGPGFAALGNATSDLAAFFQILSALATCNGAKLNLDKGQEAVGCLLNLQDACAGTQKVWRSRWRRDALQTSTSRFFDQIELANSVSDRLGQPFGQLFPFLLRDAVQSQTTESLKYFDRWFSYVAQVLGSSTLRIPTDPWYSEFTRSISDESELSEAISGNETTKILSTLTSTNVRLRPIIKPLLERWNATVTRTHKTPAVHDQSDGHIEQSSDHIQSENAAPNSALHDLTSLTNVLNALASSQGFPNNFLHLLDRDVDNLRYTLLESEGSNDCLSAVIKVEPAEVDEGDRFTLQLSLKNLLTATSIQINELTPHFRSQNPDENALVTFLKGDTKYPGTVMDPAGGQHFAYWNVETELRHRLTNAITFRVDVLLVFTQTGFRTQTETKIQSMPFTLRPKASLRVMYFLYAPVPSAESTSTRARRRPNVLVALMNNGYRDLMNLSITGAELRVTENSEKGPAASYRLDTVLVDGQAAPTSFDVRIPSLRSGEVKYVEYVLASSEAAKAQVNDFLATVLVDGEFLRSETQETFRILQWLNGSSSAATHPDTTTAADSTVSNLLLGVDTANGVQPAYLYNAKTTLLAPINEAELVGTSEGWEIINDRPYYHIRLQYRQNTQTTRPGALYGEYGLPPILNDTNDLLSGSRANGSLDPSHMWISYGGVRGADDEEATSGRVLNFVDPIMPSSQELITYEFVFGPRNTEAPAFNEKLLSIKAPSSGADAKVGTVVGKVSATDPDGGNISYGLYGGDGSFVINPKTGEIKIGRIPLASGARRACLNARATDDGVPTRSSYLPVEIIYEESANPDTQSSCSKFSNIELLPNNVERGTTAETTTVGSTVGAVTGGAAPASSQTTVARAGSTQGFASTGSFSDRGTTAEEGEVGGGTTEAESQAHSGSSALGAGTTRTSTTAGEDGDEEAETGAIRTTTAAEEEVSRGRTTVASSESAGTINSETTVSTTERGPATAAGQITSSSPSEVTPAAGGSQVTSSSSVSAGERMTTIPGTAVSGSSLVASAQSSASFTPLSGSSGSVTTGSNSATSSTPAASGSSAITSAAGASRGGSTEGTSLSSASSSTLAGGQPSAAVSVAQNEDGPLPTIGSGTTAASASAPPPIQNSALPALANTPSFLPPDLLVSLGNEVNVTSLTTDDLVLLACKLRGAQPIKPIWGIICDLGKAGAGETTSKPSSTFKRLLDQIG